MINIPSGWQGGLGGGGGVWDGQEEREESDCAGFRCWQLFNIQVTGTKFCDFSLNISGSNLI